MRKSKAEKAETRKRIVETAQQLFKKHGLQKTGVAEIMAAAGLTHGGFYRHFESKEQLVAAACAASMDVLARAAEAIGQGSHQSFLKHLARFLSADHRDDALGGCPLCAIGSELVRADPLTKKVASDGIGRLVDAFGKWMPIESEATARAEALFVLSSMIGAITLSRITGDSRLSAQLLAVAKARLGAIAGSSGRRRLPKHRLPKTRRTSPDR